MQVDEGPQHALVEVVALAQVVADGCLVEALALVQERGHVLARVAQQAVLDEELDALLGVHVELLAADGHLLRPRVVFALVRVVHVLHLRDHLAELIFELHSAGGEVPGRARPPVVGAGRGAAGARAAVLLALLAGAAQRREPAVGQAQAARGSRRHDGGARPAEAGAEAGAEAAADAAAAAQRRAHKSPPSHALLTCAATAGDDHRAGREKQIPRGRRAPAEEDWFGAPAAPSSLSLSLSLSLAPPDANAVSLAHFVKH